jgi:hypothetical protein
LFDPISIQIFLDFTFRVPTSEWALLESERPDRKLGPMIFFPRHVFLSRPPAVSQHVHAAHPQPARA